MPRYEMRGFVLELDPRVLFRLVDAGEQPVNADGYRDREFPPSPSGTNRVLVLGDSFVMGYNVPVDATLPRALGDELGGGWEVRNQGIYGYGPDQSFLRLRDEGLALDPYAVVLVLFPANDFRDLVKNGLVDLSSRGMVWRRDNPVRRALPSFRLFGLLRERWSGSQLSPEVERALFVRLFADAFDLRIDPGQPEVVWKTTVMRDLLRSYRDLLERRGVRFEVVVVPSWEGIAEPDWFEQRRVAAASRFAHEDRAIGLCLDLGIPVLDLREIWGRIPDPAAAYDPADHHLSEQGNAWAAQAIGERLRRAPRP
jgi:hypothetical protein